MMCRPLAKSLNMTHPERFQLDGHKVNRVQLRLVQKAQEETCGRAVLKGHDPADESGKRESLYYCVCVLCMPLGLSRSSAGS